MAKDEELLDLLKEANLTRILIGIESLNQASLDLVNKHQNIDDIRKAAEACEKHGIRMIASIVLGLDTDHAKDIHRTVEFAKSINAYQLQPAILTPFPGTPVYEQYTKEGRMLPVSWEAHDLMNVTFLPKNFTPWELQDEFYKAAIRFYDFKSIGRIRKAFGMEYALRRFGLAVIARLGSWGARFCSLHVPGTIYYFLRQNRFFAGKSNERALAVKKADSRKKKLKDNSKRAVRMIGSLFIFARLIGFANRYRKEKSR